MTKSKVKEVVAQEPVSGEELDVITGETISAASNTEFVIEYGIEKPARIHHVAAVKYPFAQMQEGGSFLVRSTTERGHYVSDIEHRNAKAEESKKVAGRLAGATRRFSRRNPEFKFSIATTTDGVRVWRETIATE